MKDALCTSCTVGMVIVKLAIDWSSGMRLLSALLVAPWFCWLLSSFGDVVTLLEKLGAAFMLLPEKDV